MVGLALREIDKCRRTLTEQNSENLPAEGHCFILNSLKRQEEIEALRTLFGNRVYLISIYEPREQRHENLCKKIARSHQSANDARFSAIANQLIDTDQKERADPNGQRVEDVFPRADFFVKAGTGIRSDIRRFVQLLFKAPYITPNKDEYLMFYARATSHRSADLSRQVGAIIATPSGEILSTGCNEVPRAGGGVNWDNVAGTNKDYRDFKAGQDAAAAAKKEIVGDALKGLEEAGWLKEELHGKEPDELAQLALYEGDSPLSGRMVTNLLEFGRIVHAEMAAICDAAMRGVSVKGATLFCTTFPCHMCARHIVAAGLREVVYIEPYPKSWAKKLYNRAIQVDEDRQADSDAVEFRAFVGIAPSRYLDLFDMVDRKDGQGYAYAESAPHGGPKGVTFGAFVSELEARYIDSLERADWTQLRTKQGQGEANERKSADHAENHKRD